MESPTVELLINNNAYTRWEDSYQMFCLFMLDGGGLPLGASGDPGAKQC